MRWIRIGRINPPATDRPPAALSSGSVDRVSKTFGDRPFVMLTLYSGPSFAGCLTTTGGLKVYAFLRFTGIPFTDAHVVDAQQLQVASCHMLSVMVNR